MNQLAKRIVDLSVGDVTEDEEPTPSAAARKRGLARADKLTPDERSRIAKKAADARWSKEGGTE